MSDIKKKVEYDIVVTGDAAAASAFDKLGASATRLEKASAGTKLAMWGVGEQAGDLARSFGIPNQMARKLEDTTESLASKLGKGAIAFGAVGLAITAGVAAWNFYSDAQKKTHEETMKAADASMQWVEAAKIETKETDLLREAKDRLFQIEKEQNILALERGIQEQSKLIMQQYDDLEKLGKRSKTGGSGSSLLGRLLFGSKEEREKEFQDMGYEARKNYEKLLIMQEQLDLAKGNGTLRRGGSKNVEAEKYEIDQVTQFRIDGYNAAVDLNQKLVESNAASIAERLRQEELLALRQKIAQRNALDNTEGFLKMTADAHGKHGRAAFSAYKTVAIARATIATYQAAVEAFKTGSEISVYVGAAYAAAAVAYGLAQIQQIRSQSYDGGGGGGAAVPTFNANPNTGLPTGSGSGGGNITININGQRVGDYRVMAGGVLKAIYENNGSVDGFSVGVEQHA